MVIFILLFLSTFCMSQNYDTVLLHNKIPEIITTYSDKNRFEQNQFTYSCNGYKHWNNQISYQEPLHRYTCNQLKLYFERKQLSEKEILNQRALYFSDEFVKCAKQYPGYAVAIKALHKQFENTGIAKRVVSILWRGDYRAGLKKRINQLYNEIKIKNPLLIKPSLSETQCNEYKELQRVYSDISPRLHYAIEKRLKAQSEIENGREHFSIESYFIDKNISHILQSNGYFTEEFAQCSGNQLQQTIHQEAIDILQNLSLLSPHSIIYPYQNGLVDCVAAMGDYNQQGFIDNAAMIGDFCWTLLDYGQAVAEGVALGLYATAQDFVEHPILTTITAVAGKTVLTYQLCKIAYNVAEIGITTLIDSDKGKDKWDNYIAPVTQLLFAIENKQITVRDCIKGGSAFATGLIAQGKLLRGLNKFYRITHKNAFTFIKNNPLSDPKQFAATPEGIIHEIPAKVPQSYETMSNPEKGKQLVNPVRVMNPSRLILEAAYVKIIPQLKKDITSIENAYAKNIRKFQGKDLKIQFEHILGIEIGPKIKIQKLDVSGFHHDLGSVMEKSGVIKLMNKVKDKFGCIKADLYIGDKNFGEKTLFPTNWSREKVIDKILEAYDNLGKNGSSLIDMPDGKYRIKSFTNEGLEIIMNITKNGELKTAYPIL